MFGIEISDYIGYIIGFLIFMYLFGGGGKSQYFVLPTLLLQKFKSQSQPDEDGLVLDIIARQPGPVTKTLTFMGTGNLSYLKVTEHEVRVISSRFSGTSHFSVPLSDIRATSCRVEKPAGQFYLGLLLVAVLALKVIGDIVSVDIPVVSEFNSTTMLVIAVITGLFFISYFMTTRLVIAFSTSEISRQYGLAFKPALTGEAKISFEQMLSSIEHINLAIVNAQSKE